MLHYERIDISEGVDVNKTNLSKECDICHYWYFKDIGLNTNLIFVMDVMIYCNKPWVLIILLLYILKEVLMEFIFHIWVKMMQLTKLMDLT